MAVEPLLRVPAAPAVPGPAVTLRTWALAAAGTFAWGGPPEGDGWEAGHLRACLDAVALGDGDWTASLPAYLGRPAAEDVPLLDLARDLGLSLPEILAVALATAVEDDLTTGRLIAWLQAPLAGSRPTLGLLASCLEPLSRAGGGSPSLIEPLVNGPAIRSGLLTLPAEGGPLPERTVSVPLHLGFALRGRDAVLPGATIGLGWMPEIPLPPSLLAEAGRHAAGLAAGPRRSLILRTGMPAEGRSAAAAIAAALALRPLFLDTDKLLGFGPWCLLRGLLPVFCVDPGPGERRVLPALPGYDGPVLALGGPDGSIEITGSSPLTWSLPVPPREERRELWRRALGEGDGLDALATDLARHHRHGSGRIATLGRLALHRSRLAGHDRPTRADVAAAAWSGDGTGLDALAQPLPDPIPDEALVAPDTLRQELRLLLLRCQGRDGLVDRLGVSARARYRPGVRGLLIGPSGTGKTLAAGWLATRLGIPLYRVDLAAVTSKYIGETEKNLAQLLARAEQSEVVLLFDEADSLFGKRTDIKDSNDRFANAQTNYLLQRLESWDGIALLTSNSRSRFDPAFMRRLDAILDFPLPGPEERRLLWSSHLGEGHRLPPSEISKLAALADLGGGHIRNVVLAAAVLAQSEERPIESADVLLGLLAEYRKLGRQVPLELKHTVPG